MNCAKCQKPEALCLCRFISAVNTNISVLILQHPQEPKEPLSTAYVAHLCLPSSKLRIGLSWPNLEKAWGEKVDKQFWGVLYLGTKKNSANARELVSVIDRKGEASPRSKEILNSLEGIVILDGTWAQAKTLWWRNSWLIKLKRLVLAPKTKSLYSKLRREPRADSVCTLEAIALCLSVLEKDENISQQLLLPLHELLKLV